MKTAPAMAQKMELAKKKKRHSDNYYEYTPYIQEGGRKCDEASHKRFFKDPNWILEMKNTVSEMQNILYEINSRIDNTEEKISELKDSNRKYAKWNIMRKDWKKEQSIELWVKIKWPSVCVACQKKKLGAGIKIIEEIMAEKFSKYDENYKPSVQGVYIWS